MVKAVEEHNFTDEISCPATFSPPKEINLEEVAADVCADMVNATLDPNNSYAIVPSKTGVTFDRVLAQSMYDSAAAGQEIIVPLTVAQPDVTTEDLQTKLFRDTLASYYTYAGGTEARLQNISKAAASCSGTILLPGESFSYNQTLGERTLERGYQKAGAYSYNEVIEEIGGGICQVSSTIFSAVLYTELAVDERNNHSMPVSYLPQGMDAAVSWGSLDFVFRNTYDYPVKLNVSFDGYTIGVEILGTKEDGHYIDIRLDQLDSYSAKTTRLVYDSNGSLISEELIAYSNYQNPNEKKNTEDQEQTTETETETENGDNSGEYTNNNENSETAAGETGGNDGTGDGTGDDDSDRYWEVVEDPYGDSIGDQVDLYGDAPDYTYGGTYDTEAYWE
ncbi:MAG: VanW family protein, partial [Blautia sp.]|nr:VanW family protein [Blautia sp.]